MVAAAEQDQVAELRRATVRPMLQVMAVRPIGGTIAAGEPAASVAHDKRSPERGRHRPHRAAGVKRLA